MMGEAIPPVPTNKSLTVTIFETVIIHRIGENRCKALFGQAYQPCKSLTTQYVDVAVAKHIIQDL